MARVATVSTARTNPKVTSNGNSKRPPLLPSEAEYNNNTNTNNNNNNNINNNEEHSRRKSKYKEVTSRYLSSSSASSSTISSVSTTSSSNSSVRSHSPMLTRTPVQNSGSRSQSVDRRRPAVTSAAAKQLLLKSSRSLSVSFQGESYSMPVSKAKVNATPVTPISSVRKCTPVRDRDRERERVRSENVKLSDQHRWPGRLKSLNSSFMTQSLDCGGDSIDKAKFGSGGGSVVRSSMNNSVIDIYVRARIEPKLLKPHQSDNADVLGSDSESVSSGSSSGGLNRVVQGRGGGGQRGIVVPARVWQETNNRIRRGGQELASSPVEKNGTKLKTVGNNKKFLSDSPTMSPRGVPTSRGLGSSPLQGGSLRPASPNKTLMTPSLNSTLRGIPSPTRARNGVMGSITHNNSCVMPSMLSFAADARRGKVRENRMVDAHELRLLYNRYMQWRFANARAEAVLKSQAATAERTLYNAWLTTLKLRHSVKSKRIQLQLLQQNMKLYSILKGQGSCLENWSIIDGDHCNSLSGAICALEASTIRLPVVEGARAEAQNVKDAISSAVDVMQAMGSSVSSLLSKVEQVDSMAYELAGVAANEHALLDRCNELLSSLTALQVKESSLRTHLLQLKDAGSCSTTQV